MALSLLPSSGSYICTPLRAVHWGPGSVSALPSIIRSLVATNDKNAKPKAMIITGKSLLEKTPVINNVRSMLEKEGMFGAVFSEIGQHAPIKQIKAAQKLAEDNQVNVLVSVGGGSPIDSAKAIAYFIHESSGADHFIPHIAVPTTLSVAETTQNAGFTNEQGQKAGVNHPDNAPRAIIYDAELAMYTPLRLWLSTGMRAVDHAVETMYRDGAPPQVRHMALFAVKGLFEALEACKKDPDNIEIRQRCFLAAWESLWPLARAGALGLSHGLGHKLGATYGIPHGICSVLTLPETVKLMSANLQGYDLAFLAMVHAFLPAQYQGSVKALGLDAASAPEAEQRAAAEQVGIAVGKLVETLELKSTLSEYKVPREDLEGIAGKVDDAKPEGAPYNKKQVIEAILNKIY
ncbi:hypothetical protein QFC20_005067 [Naganishia adeliensis]|uniref:Uncharacterized protein n=1 Tax=Naganishia adeliensis TaxID=92952 RepID=A0ACC2VSV9_9TREE|nr:hypothetical protein QFC20_005067 [Naganishia adeliensis]